MNTEFELLKITAVLDNSAADGLVMHISSYGKSVETEKSIKFASSNISKDKFMVASTNSTSNIGNLFSQIYCAAENEAKAIEMLKAHLISQYFSKMDSVIESCSAMRKMICKEVPVGTDVTGELTKEENAWLKGMADMVIARQKL